MLTLRVLGQEATIELLDGSTEFVTIGGYNLELEHSLVALSKWESKYKKPFLSEESKTSEEILYYIRSMAIDPYVPDEVFSNLTNEHLKGVNEYINDPMTATWFNEKPQAPKPGGEAITSELIYFWIAGFGFDAAVVERWHLNRLFTALRIANIKNQPEKKMSRAEVLADMRKKNAQRRAQFERAG